MKYRFAQQALAVILTAITVASLVVAFMTPARADDCNGANPYEGMLPPDPACLSAPAPPFCSWVIDAAAYAACLAEWENGEHGRAWAEARWDAVCTNYEGDLDGCQEDYDECMLGASTQAEADACQRARDACEAHAARFRDLAHEYLADEMGKADDGMENCDCCELACESAARQIVLFETVTWCDICPKPGHFHGEACWVFQEWAAQQEEEAAQRGEGDGDGA